MRIVRHSVALFLFSSFAAIAQQQTGELRLQVVDASGAAIQAGGELAGAATQVRKAFTTNPNGQYTIAALPFGLYHLTIQRSGFAPASALIEIRSQVPLNYKATLGVAVVETTVTVQDADTLLNPDRTGAQQTLGPETLRTRALALPSRAAVSLVDSQPGWLLEANGVLHPRGFEYGVQYVVDGLPMLDNRSPVFAPALSVEEFQSFTVRTGGYPAEYGHQLGGVVEVTTARDTRPGWHGNASTEAGSFGTVSGYASVQYVSGRNTFGVAGNGMRTDRYLDPPVEQNYTNHGSGGGFSARFGRDWSDGDRTRLLVRHNRTGFLVPNERLQELAGQRQDRTAEETSGQIAHTHLFSSRVLSDLRLLTRDVSAGFWSNRFSTPIAPGQQRGFREAYLTGSVSAQLGAHDLKFGGEALFRSLTEDFGYQITTYRVNGVRIFDRDTPARFHFSDRRQNREQGAFAQDLMRFGSLTISAGVRWDHYRLIVDEQAVSPRVAAAWQIPHTGFVLRASFDRAFQTPAIENLLLASSPALLALNNAAVSVAVRPSRGNFYETGFSKALWNHVRLDGSYFRRLMRNFSDDDVLLNTGVSFPIAFDRGDIQGVEAKLEVPRWGRFSGFLSYTNLIGHGELPVVGGLFLDDNAADLFTSKGRFAITQDQRNTARARVRAELHPRIWLAAGAQYGSGLPVEVDASSFNLLAQQYGPRVVQRVNFSRGRVRPNFAFDLSGGADLMKRERATVRLQADVQNLTGRLNVINFAGLFSGTALNAPRSAAVRLQFEF